MQKLETNLGKLQSRFTDQMKSYSPLEFTVEKQGYQIDSTNKTMENLQKQMEGNNCQLAPISIKLNAILLRMNEWNMMLDVGEGTRIDNSISGSKQKGCHQIPALFDFGSLREANQKLEMGREELRYWRIEQRNFLQDYIDEFEAWRKLLLRIALNLQPEDFINKFISGLNRKMESRAYIWFANFQRKHQNITWEAFMISFCERFDYELRKERADAILNGKIEEKFGGLMLKEMPIEAHEINEKVRNEQMAVAACERFQEPIWDEDITEKAEEPIWDEDITEKAEEKFGDQVFDEMSIEVHMDKSMSIEEIVVAEARLEFATHEIEDDYKTIIESPSGKEQSANLMLVKVGFINEMTFEDNLDIIKGQLEENLYGKTDMWNKPNWFLGQIDEQRGNEFIFRPSASNYLFATLSLLMDEDQVIYVFDPGGNCWTTLKDP